MSDVQRPTVGRIVHCYEQRRDIPDAPLEGPYAAIVIEVPPHHTNLWAVLRIFKPYSDERVGAPYDDSEPPKPRTWRWPPTEQITVGISTAISSGSRSRRPYAETLRDVPLPGGRSELLAERSAHVAPASENRAPRRP